MEKRGNMHYIQYELINKMGDAPIKGNASTSARGKSFMQSRVSALLNGGGAVGEGGEGGDLHEGTALDGRSGQERTNPSPPPCNVHWRRIRWHFRVCFLSWTETRRPISGCNRPGKSPVDCNCYQARYITTPFCYKIDVRQEGMFFNLHTDYQRCYILLRWVS